jgi:hypothetical protein
VQVARCVPGQSRREMEPEKRALVGTVVSCTTDGQMSCHLCWKDRTERDRSIGV